MNDVKSAFLIRKPSQFHAFFTTDISKVSDLCNQTVFENIKIYLEYIHLHMTEFYTKLPIEKVFSNDFLVSISYMELLVAFQKFPSLF